MNRNASAPSARFVRCAIPTCRETFHVAQLAERHVAVDAHAGREDCHADARRDERDGPLLRLHHRRDVESPAPAGEDAPVSARPPATRKAQKNSPVQSTRYATLPRGVAASAKQTPSVNVLAPCRARRRSVLR